MRQTSESQGTEDLRRGGLHKLLARPVNMQARPMLTVHDGVEADAMALFVDTGAIERMAESFRNALPAVQDLGAVWHDGDEGPQPQQSAPKTAFPRECFGCNRVMLMNEGATHCQFCRADDVIRQLDAKSYRQREREVASLERYNRQERERHQALTQDQGRRYQSRTHGRR